MDLPTAGKSANTSFSIRYNANNEELEEVLDDDPPTPQTEPSPGAHGESPTAKKLDKAASIIDKYFKSIRTDKEETKNPDPPKAKDEDKSTGQKEPNSSPMKDYLHRLGKRHKDTELAVGDKDVPNETWKIFHDFKFKIAQAVEDIKSQRSDEKEKSIPRDNSVSDSEENSVVRDSDQHSVGDTDNQVSSLDSSMQNLSEQTQAVTAKVSADGSPRSRRRSASESSDDTQKNFDLNEIDSKEPGEDSLLEVESGVEALEESNVLDASPAPPPPLGAGCPPYLAARLLPTPKESKSSAQVATTQTYFLTFSMTFFTVVLLVSYTLMPGRHAWNGFVLGVWALRFAGALKAWLLDRLCDDSDTESYRRFRLGRIETPSAVTYTIPSIEEHRPLKKYEGWINHYRYEEYDPYVYHINKTTTAFMKLEGSNLRISYTHAKISKKAFWSEEIENVTFYQHRLYNLVGARVILQPKGLVKKRLWSKKYPICVILNEKEKVQVLEKEPSVERREERERRREAAPAAEEGAAPADGARPRKKFVWRRKDKDANDSPSLRQRIKSKIHKDKKTEDASTGTDPVMIVPEKTYTYEDESSVDPIPEKASEKTKDENNLEVEQDTDQCREFQRIKEFLDEAEELETGKESPEGATEWSLHVREYSDMHANLFIFARTSRDKHEWYRRIRTAIGEAGGGVGADSGGEEGNTESLKENDMSVFRLADRDSIAYAKSSTSAFDMAPEPVAVSWADDMLRSIDLRAHEREFWPYMYKIFQRFMSSFLAKDHKMNALSTSNSMGVSGSADSTIKDHRSKGFKEAKESNKAAKARKKEKRSGGYQQQSKQNLTAEAGGLPLPPDIAWLNALIGRIAYDAMRNPSVVARLQRRIQRKLNTLKLPTFMGRLVATELSLGSTAPRVALLGAPTCDERGVWLSAEVRYEGGAYISLNTQLNLMVFKEKKITLEEQLERLDECSVDQDLDELVSAQFNLSPTSPPPPPPLPHKKPAIYDSEVDDSAESSSDEDSACAAPAPVVFDDKLPPSETSSTEGGSSTKKFLRIVDKITTNRYFQQVTDYKYVKRAMEGLSNTDIKLHLELKGLEGELVLNLPPPPHDRLWIGFRSNPRIWLKARPALGARAVRFTHVTNWIEQKLCKEFEKVLVLPNMEDLLVDLMTPTPVDFE